MSRTIEILTGVSPFHLQGRGYVDQCQFALDPREGAIITLVARKLNEVREALDWHEQLPGRLAFRRALQGTE